MEAKTRSSGRREFLIGAGLGVAGAGAAWLATRNKWSVHEGATTCFAQCGEDLIVAELFRFLEIQKPTFIDIGAFMPIRYNNTYLLYTQGSRGVLVEPNVDLIDELKKQRPEDTVLNIGIGFADKEEQTDYYRMSLPQWNTFDGDEAKRRVTESKGDVKITEVVKMPLVPLKQVFDKHFGGKAPDFFSVDTEGLDLAILKTIDFKNTRPKIICAETLVALSHRMDPAIGDFLAQHDYVARGVTFPNTIFVDKGLLK